MRYRLTGVLAQEISDASGTNLLDVPARRWSKEIMDKLGLSMSLLPPLVESCEAAGANLYDEAGLIANDSPNEEAREACRELGRKLAAW